MSSGKAIAIIPARGGSKRIPRKNIVSVCGQPMISYPIRTALGSGVFDRVIVSTEDTEIKEIAETYGAEAVDRPDELANDTAMEIDVYGQVLDVLKERDGYEPEFFCGIYPTSILVEAEDYRNSFSLLNEKKEAGVLMSVSEYPIHPFKALEADENGFLQMVHPKECMMRSQTYPKYVASNGTFYWFRVGEYRRSKSYYCEHLLPFVLSPERAVDIDEPKDLAMAEAFLKMREG